MKQEKKDILKSKQKSLKLAKKLQENLKRRKESVKPETTLNKKDKN